MDILVLISDDVHTAALRKARQIGQKASLSTSVLHAPLDDDSTSWVDQIWDCVEGAVQKAYRGGIEAARPLIETVAEQMAKLTTELSTRADAVRLVLFERLNAYLSGVIDSAIQRIRPSVTIGGRELLVSHVSISQQIRLSGSVKASLEALCEFVAEGELSVSAEYGEKLS